MGLKHKYMQHQIRRNGAFDVTARRISVTVVDITYILSQKEIILQ